MPTSTGSENPGQPPPLKKYKSANGAVVTQYAAPQGHVAPQSTQPSQNAWSMAYGQNPYSYQGYGQYPHQQQAYPAYPGYAGYHGYQGYAATGWQQPYPYQHYGYPNAQYQMPLTANSTAAGQQNHQSDPEVQMAPTTQSANEQVHGTTWSAPDPSPRGPTVKEEEQDSFKPTDPASAFPSEVKATADAECNIALDEEDYCREASFAKDGGENVQSQFSLGTIAYFSARPVKTVLPATFAEAESNLLTRKPREGEDESISKYFVKSLAGNVNLSVRQIEEEWKVAKDDMIFREFLPATSAEYVTLEQVKKERERPDPDPSRRNPPLSQSLGTAAAPQGEAHSAASQTGDSNMVDKENGLPAKDDDGDDDSDEGAMDCTSDADDDEDMGIKVLGASKTSDRVLPASGTPQEKQKTAEKPPPQNDVRRGHWSRRGSPSSRPVSRGTYDSRYWDHSSYPDRRSYEDHMVSRYEGERSDNRYERERYDDRYDDRYAGARFDGRYEGDRFDGRYGGERSESRYEWERSESRYPRQSFDQRREEHYRRRESAPQQYPYGPHHAPPPPKENTYNPWRNMGGFRRASDASGSGQRPTTVSDLDGHNDRSRPSYETRTPEHVGSGRKRGHEEMERSNGQRGSRQEDDTYRQRGFRPKVPEAYSRR